MVQINRSNSFTSGSTAVASADDQIVENLNDPKGSSKARESPAESIETSRPKISSAESSQRKAEVGLRGASRQFELQRELGAKNVGVAGMQNVEQGQGAYTQMSATANPQAGPGPTVPPDPFKVPGYNGVATEKGTIEFQGSDAVAVNYWIKDVRHSMTEGPAREVAEDLQLSAEDFMTNGRNHATEINRALQHDLKRGAIGKLDNKTDGRITQGLRSYQEWNTKAKDHSEGVKEASQKLVAAENGLKVAESKLEKRELEDLNAETKKEMAAIQEKMKSRQDILDFVKKSSRIAIDVAKDPLGGAAKHGLPKLEEAAMDLLSREDQQKIIQLTAKTAAIEKKIHKTEDIAVRASLDQAKANLEAAKSTFIREKLALQGAKEMTHNAIDDLAAAEKQNPGTTTVFGKLQSYYQDMSALGKDLQDLSQDYVAELKHGPISRGNEISERIANDQQTVSYIKPNSENRRALEEFEYNSNTISGYAKNLEQWRQKEIARQTRLQDDLRQDNHLAFASNILEQVGQKGLGHTYDDRYQTR
ncbi:hypothetical protein L0244_34960 [bacterium]|nr:hypothetical protein [bacterium]